MPTPETANPPDIKQHFRSELSINERIMWLGATGFVASVVAGVYKILMLELEKSHQHKTSDDILSWTTLSSMTGASVATLILGIYGMLRVSFARDKLVLEIDTNTPSQGITEELTMAE